MPIDVSGAVTAEYTDAIPVPLDGEYANSTALQNMVLPIANRVEYLNQGLIDAPFEIPLIKEDWLSMQKVSTLVHGDSGPWVYSESAVAYSTPTQGNSAATGGSAGILRLENASGSAAVAAFVKEAQITRNKIRRLSVRLQMFSTTANKAFQFGMFTGGTTAIGSGDTEGFGVIFDPAVDANIRTVGVTGGVYTYTSTGIPPVAGTHYQFDIDQDVLGVATLNVQGSGAYSFSGMPLIGADLFPNVRLGTTNAGSRQFNWDLFYLQLAVSRY